MKNVKEEETLKKTFILFQSFLFRFLLNCYSLPWIDRFSKNLYGISW